MLSLSSRIGSRNQRSRLDQAKLPLAKEPPTLPCPHGHAIGSLDVGRQRLTVPQIAGQAEIGGPPSQRALYFRHLLRIQPARASGTLPFLQPRQALLLEAAHPIFDRSWCITQQFGDSAAVHTLRHQQYAMQTVVITGFRTSPNLILQTKNNHRRVRNCQCSHAPYESTLPRYSQLFMSVRIAP